MPFLATWTERKAMSTPVNSACLAKRDGKFLEADVLD